MTTLNNPSQRLFRLTLLVLVIGLAVALSTVLFASAASARSVASLDERGIIVREGVDVPGFRLPPRCERVYVSTVDSTWTLVSWVGPSVPGCGSWAAGGSELVHLDGGLWTAGRADNEWTCSAAPRSMRPAVANDLLRGVRGSRLHCGPGARRPPQKPRPTHAKPRPRHLGAVRIRAILVRELGLDRQDNFNLDHHITPGDIAQDTGDCYVKLGAAAISFEYMVANILRSPDGLDVVFVQSNTATPLSRCRAAVRVALGW